MKNKIEGFYQKVFGPGYVESNNQEKVYKVKKTLIQSKELQKKIDQIEKFQLIQQEGLIGIEQLQMLNQNDNSCNEIMIQYTIKTPQYSLYDLQQKGYEFQAIELLCIIYSVLQQIQLLESQGISHMYLHPKLIFVDLTEKQKIEKVYVANRFNNRENFVLNYRLDLKDKECFYLTKEIYELLINKITKIDIIYIQQLDVFSLGLIVLELGLGRNIQKLFDEKNKVFSIEKFDEFFEEFQTKFQLNVFLISLMTKLLEINAKKRPNPKILFESLPEWKLVEQIYKRKTEKNVQQNYQATIIETQSLNNSENYSIKPYKENNLQNSLEKKSIINQQEQIQLIDNDCSNFFESDITQRKKQLVFSNQVSTYSYNQAINSSKNQIQNSYSISQKKKKENYNRNNQKTLQSFQFIKQVHIEKNKFQIELKSLQILKQRKNKQSISQFSQQYQQIDIDKLLSQQNIQSIVQQNQTSQYERIVTEEIVQNEKGDFQKKYLIKYQLANRHTNYTQFSNKKEQSTFQNNERSPLKQSNQFQLDLSQPSIFQELDEEYQNNYGITQSKFMNFVNSQIMDSKIDLSEEEGFNPYL